ncbi:MAG: hypothetical protein LR001_02725 [Clostridiales bacterium]|nr:hypothetical protein [Clostridiales bacterium]
MKTNIVDTHTVILVSLLEFPFSMYLCAKYKEPATRITNSGRYGAKKSSEASPMPPKPRDKNIMGPTQQSIANSEEIAAPKASSFSFIEYNTPFHTKIIS